MAFTEKGVTKISVDDDRHTERLHLIYHVCRRLKLPTDLALSEHAFWFADYLTAFICEHSLARVKALHVLLL